MNSTGWLSYLTVAVLVFQSFIAFRQSRISEKQKDLLVGSLDIQTGQKDIAQNEFISTHRPKIIIRNVHFVSLYEPGQPVSIEFRYINVGETDAKIEIIEADVFSSRRDDVSFEKRALIKCDYDKTSLRSGESGIASIKRADNSNCSETGDSRDRVFCVGCVQYRDRGGVHRQTGFARVYDPDTRRFDRSDDEEYEYSY